MIQSHKLKWLTLILCLFVLAALIKLIACRSQETDLVFATIERRDTSGTGQVYKDKEPGLLVVAQSSEASQLDELVTPDALARVKALSYETSFAIVVFQGWKPTTRYSAQIERVMRQGDEITIYAKFTEPRPDEPTGGMITSPYELAQVNKMGVWARNISFRVVVDEQSVVSLTHFVP